jgi:ribokinase
MPLKETFKMPTKILMVGSVMMDSIYTVDRAPELGESVLGVVYGTACGGKGSNAAVAAQRLGAKVTVFGTLGNDGNGETLKKMLSGEGINTKAMRVKEGAKSGSVVILLEKGGKNRLVICPGANMETTPEGLEETFAEEKFDALLLQLEIPLEANIAAVKLAQKQGVITVLDAGPAQEYPLEKLKGLDILSPNETETKALTGIYPADLETCRSSAKILAERNGCKYVALKLGDRGSYIYGAGVDALVPPFKVVALDPTAAGDAFTGALALKYAQTKDILASARYANAVGALSTLKVGAQPSLPTDKEVDAFIASYK